MAVAQDQLIEHKAFVYNAPISSHPELFIIQSLFLNSDFQKSLTVVSLS